MCVFVMLTFSWTTCYNRSHSNGLGTFITNLIPDHVHLLHIGALRQGLANSHPYGSDKVPAKSNNNQAHADCIKMNTSYKDMASYVCKPIINALVHTYSTLCSVFEPFPTTS